MKTKMFDAVKMMREIRDELSQKYTSDPTAQKKDLEAIRQQYRFDEKLNTGRKNKGHYHRIDN